uniref:Uncharacterized protein n=1 Tax=Leptobrachium leishanense TaxID=445787 RepID=A0A8C5QAT6_9ANUR
MDSGILENLRSDQNHQKQRDPRLTMELRHQQVKENRERRQKTLERQRQERALKKDTMAQAQALVQEETKQKALKIKKDEEEIQRVMVKLRKDMTERRKAVEEARRMEWNKEMESSRVPQGKTEAEREPRKEENGRRKLENQARIQTRLAQVYAENRRCLQKYFSAWYKLVLERRVKMGKARALADWKCQLRAFRAWKNHVWARKMEQESQKMETDLREQNRKQQLASESYRKRLLRQHFAAWQLWCLAEKEKRELEAHKEETKRKMAALLDAASSLATSNAKSTEQRDVSAGGSASREQTTEKSKAPNDGPRTATMKKTPTQPPDPPKHAWQVTRKHAELTPEELKEHRPQSSRSTPRHTANAHKKSSPYGEVYENRHHFQQQLIEEQKKQLQEQKEMILGLVENQRLFISRREATRATAVTAEMSSKDTPGKGRSREEPPALDNEEKASRFVCPSVHPGNTSPAPSAVSTARRCSAPRDSSHPVVRAMEERAAQRLERKRQLEDRRRRRQEEKLAQLKAAEEERVQREAAEREAEAERRREEKRLQKQLEQEKQQRLQWERELQVKACAHYEKTLLRRLGLDPWKKLMAEFRLAAERAEGRHRAAVMKRCLVAWQVAVRDIIASKVSRADQLQTTILLRRGFQHWVKYKDYLSILEERAEQHHAATLRKKTFLAWMDLAQEEKLAMWQKQRAAAEHNQRRILLAAFRMWRNFPKFMQELKRKEERREMLRKRVAEILPDFRL